MRKLLDALGVPWLIAGGAGLACALLLFTCYQSGKKAAAALEDMTGQRDALLTIVTGLCDLAGVKAEGEGWAEACKDRIRALATFERETEKQSVAALNAAFEEQRRKLEAAAAAAQRDAARNRAALDRMRAADAAVVADTVGRDWFGALNDVAGLSAPEQKDGLR